MIQRFRKGQPITASRLNQIIDQAQDPVALARRAQLPIAQGLAVRAFQITAIGGDFVAGREIGADGAFSSEIAVIAKPWTLRRSPFDNATYAGISYVYSSDTERVATDVATSDTENQVIVPYYTASTTAGQGDIIYCALGFTGPTITDAVTGARAQWIDLNLDARAWAQSAA